MRDAIAAANTDAVVDGCAAGDDHDRISFSFTGGILLEAALPTISKSLEIAGPGPDSMLIDGDDQFRIFDSIIGQGSLIFRGLHLFQGSADSGGCIGGAISNLGTLSLFNTVVAGNIETNTNQDTADILNAGAGTSISLGFNLIVNNESERTFYQYSACCRDVSP